MRLPITSFAFIAFVLPLTSSALRAADSVRLTSLWSRQNANIPFSDPVADGDRIFVGSEDHSFYALDATTGAEVWHHATGGKIHGRPLVTDSHVYFESDDRKLYKLTRDSGQLVWSFTIPGAAPVRDPNIYFHFTTSTPVLRDGRILLGSGNRHFYCLDDRDGSVVWSFEAADRIRADPAFANGKVIVAAFGPTVYALSETTGKLVWEKQVRADPEKPFLAKMLPSPVISGNLAIMGFRNWDLQAFDVDTGEVKWTVVYDGSWVEATGRVIDDRLYIGSSDASLVRCYESQTGEILWETAVGGRAYGAPSRIGDHLIFGLSGHSPNNRAFDSGIVTINLRNGHIDGKVDLPKPGGEDYFGPFGVLGHTTALAGVVTFSDESGNLHAYTMTSGATASVLR